MNCLKTHAVVVSASLLAGCAAGYVETVGEGAPRVEGSDRVMDEMTAPDPMEPGAINDGTGNSY